MRLETTRATEDASGVLRSVNRIRSWIDALTTDRQLCCFCAFGRSVQGSHLIFVWLVAAHDTPMKRRVAPSMPRKMGDIIVPNPLKFMGLSALTSKGPV